MRRYEWPQLPASQQLGSANTLNEFESEIVPEFSGKGAAG